MTLILGGALPEKWRPAAMAWCPDAVRDNAGERGLFRRTFDMDAVPESFRVLVSADSRYRLFVNGTPVGRGPLKGTLKRYHFEEWEVAPLLRPGRNVLAADVVWFGHNVPLSEEHSGFAGLLVRGPEGAGVDTPGEWRAWYDRALVWDRTPYTSNAHLFIAGTERLDGRALPVGWESPDFDDSAWPAAALAVPLNAPGGDRDQDLVWNFAPRDAPALIEEPRRFIRTLEGMRPAEHRFGETPTGWELPAGQGGEIVLDAGELSTGYPRFAFAGGEGRTVEIVYSEHTWLRNPDVPDDGSPYRWGGGKRLMKGKRDDLADGQAIIHGYQDTVTLPGGEFAYEPFHWRTFWFVRVVVSPGDTPFRLTDAAYRFTTYPQERKSECRSSEPDVERILDVSWRTLQLCSHETYEDCPYYEQLDYLFDARNEAMISMYLAGETALPKRTIRLFRDSLRPDGMLASRTPSALRQTIPIFALWWIRMLADLWDWAGPAEAPFLRDCLYAADGVLGYFRNHLRPDGFVGELPYWNPIGGEDAPGSDLDPAIKAGGSTYVTALYLAGLEDACRLHRELGYPEDADRWAPTRDRLRAAVASAWSDARGVYVERPEAPDAPVSQHTQAQAILAGVPEGATLARMLDSIAAGVPVSPMTRQQGLPFAEALYAAGRYDLAARQYMAEYRAMLGLNLTTWLESGFQGRSDCHAWSAWAPVELLRSVLGVRPGRPGFAEVVIAPQPVFPDAEGTVATPAGPVRVAWQRGEDGRIARFEAAAPSGVPVTVRLPGEGERRFPDGGRIDLGGGA
jgi:hypothetical protein